jgi:hypothetical protein
MNNLITLLLRQMSPTSKSASSIGLIPMSGIAALLATLLTGCGDDPVISADQLEQNVRDINDAYMLPNADKDLIENAYSELATLKAGFEENPDIDQLESTVISAKAVDLAIEPGGFLEVITTDKHFGGDYVTISFITNLNSLADNGEALLAHIGAEPKITDNNYAQKETVETGVYAGALQLLQHTDQKVALAQDNDPQASIKVIIIDKADFLKLFPSEINENPNFINVGYNLIEGYSTGLFAGLIDNNFSNEDYEGTIFLVKESINEHLGENNTYATDVVEYFLIHEVAHALNLAHPFDKAYDSEVLDGIDMTFASLGKFPENELQNDTFSLNSGCTTILAYDSRCINEGGNLKPVSPGVLDIAALQALYGINADNNQHSYDLSELDANEVLTVFAVGGDDEIDASDVDESKNVTIDLRSATLDEEGGSVFYNDGVLTGYGIGGFLSAVWSSTPYYGSPEKAIKIAYDWDSEDFMIADATGHAGLDYIYANDISNWIDCGGGNDVVFYDGLRSDYTVTTNQVIRKANDVDIDTLYNCEFIFFMGDEHSYEF